VLDTKGPLLLSLNHPNSFLDAVIIATLFKYPVYSLARGDVFRSKFIRFALKTLNIMPVYRITEGAENIGHNYKTFDACKEIFKRNGNVLIFCEGYCINEWHLRPLKKGPARLVTQAWENNIPLQILPVGINYDSFARLGKNIILNTGTLISKDNFNLFESAGKNIGLVTELLTQQIQPLVLEIKPGDINTRKKIFYVHQPALKKVLLFIPAFLGLLIHFPLYFLVKQYVKQSNIHSAHFDSMMVGLLLIAYPFYLILFAVIAFLLFGGWLWLGVFAILPFCAWSCIQLKPQF
jgi:1-acyl-sn-glycerol-3-phosphate acyltransferase